MIFVCDIWERIEKNNKNLVWEFLMQMLQGLNFVERIHFHYQTWELHGTRQRRWRFVFYILIIIQIFVFKLWFRIKSFCSLKFQIKKCLFCWRFHHFSQSLTITSTLFSLNFRILIFSIVIVLLKTIYVLPARWVFATFITCFISQLPKEIKDLVFATIELYGWPKTRPETKAPQKYV